MSATIVDMLARQVAARPDMVLARFRRRGVVEAQCTFQEAWWLAQTWADAFRKRGVHRGEAVVLSLPNSLDFVGAYFGAMFAGAAPVATAPLRGGKRYDDRQLRVLAQQATAVAARIVVIPEEQRDFMSSLSVSVLTHRDLDALNSSVERALPKISPDDTAMLQFTSGTSSAQKAVQLTHAALCAQVCATARALGVSEQSADSVVSWLPLFHDMGLIGFFLTSTLYGLTVTFLRSEDFVHWMKATSDYGATIIGGPPSAYALCARYAKDSEVDDLDLRSVRVALVGAELVDERSLELFIKKFERAGFDGRRLIPAYGLAENALAVTITPPDEGYRVDEILLGPLQQEGIAVEALESQRRPGATRTVVSAGLPISNTEVTIRARDGTPVGDRVVGEIVVRSPSLMKGYWGNPEETAQALRNGWLWTGDLGYTARRALYVTGRRNEVLIVGGRKYHPRDLEEIIDSIPGVYPGRVAAISCDNAERFTESVVVFAETSYRENTERAKLRQQIRESLTRAGFPCSDVFLVKYQTIRATSSGKLMRLELRTRYLAGEFSHDV